jgi:hypothetical protein
MKRFDLAKLLQQRPFERQHPHGTKHARPAASAHSPRVPTSRRRRRGRALDRAPRPEPPDTRQPAAQDAARERVTLHRSQAPPSRITRDQTRSGPPCGGPGTTQVPRGGPPARPDQLPFAASRVCSQALISAASRSSLSSTPCLMGLIISRNGGGIVSGCVGSFERSSPARERSARR